MTREEIRIAIDQASSLDKEIILDHVVRSILQDAKQDGYDRLDYLLEKIKQFLALRFLGVGPFLEKNYGTNISKKHSNMLIGLFIGGFAANPHNEKYWFEILEKEFNEWKEKVNDE